MELPSPRSVQTTMNKLVSVACLVASVSGFPMAFPDGPPPHGIAFPKPGADGGYGNEGHGEHYFDYNHTGKDHKAPAYAPPAPAYAPKPAYAPVIRSPEKHITNVVFVLC